MRKLYEILFTVSYICKAGLGHITVKDIVADDIQEAYDIAKEHANTFHPDAIVPTINGGFTTITENNVVLEEEDMEARLCGACGGDATICDGC